MLDITDHAAAAAAAVDPATGPESLFAIVQVHPDLRPLVAQHPAAYDGLLEWLAALNDPAVATALANRPNPAAPRGLTPPDLAGVAGTADGSGAAPTGPYDSVAAPEATAIALPSLVPAASQPFPPGSTIGPAAELPLPPPPIPPLPGSGLPTPWAATATYDPATGSAGLPSFVAPSDWQGSQPVPDPSDLVAVQVPDPAAGGPGWPGGPGASGAAFTVTGTPPQRQPRVPKLVVWLVGAAVLVAGGFAGWWVFLGGRSPDGGTVRVADVPTSPAHTWEWQFPEISASIRPYVSFSSYMTLADNLAVITPSFDRYHWGHDNDYDLDWYAGYDADYDIGFDAGRAYYDAYRAWRYSSNRSYPRESAYYPNGIAPSSLGEGVYDGWNDASDCGQSCYGYSRLIEPPKSGFSAALYCLDTATGQTLWTHDPSSVLNGYDDQEWTRPYVLPATTQVVYYVPRTNQGVTITTLVALDGQTGRVLSESTLDGYVSYLRVVGERIVVVETFEDSSRIAAYDPDRLQDPLWTQRIDADDIRGIQSFGADTVAVLGPNSRTLWTAGDALFQSGDVEILDAATGQDAPLARHLSRGDGVIALADGYMKVTIDSEYEDSMIGHARIMRWGPDFVDRWETAMTIDVLSSAGSSTITVPGDPARGIVARQCTGVSGDSSDTTCDLMRVDLKDGQAVWDRPVRDIGAVVAYHGNSVIFLDEGNDDLIWVDWRSGREQHLLSATTGGTLSTVGQSTEHLYATELVWDQSHNERRTYRLVAFDLYDATRAWATDLGEDISVITLGHRLTLIDREDQTLSGLG